MATPQPTIEELVGQTEQQLLWMFAEQNQKGYSMYWQVSRESCKHLLHDHILDLLRSSQGATPTLVRIAISHCNPDPPNEDAVLRALLAARIVHSLVETGADSPLSRAIAEANWSLDSTSGMLSSKECFS